MFENLVDFFDDFTKNQRIESLNTLAEENGFEYHKKEPFGNQPSQLKGFKATAMKGTKRLLGVCVLPLRGLKGTIRFYDFLNTKDLETKTTSIIEIFTEDIFSEYLMISPKNAFGKMKGFFVSDKKDYPDQSEFYKNYHITTKNPEDDYHLKESVIKVFGQNPGLTMESEGNYFIFYNRKKEMKIPVILENIDFAEEVVQLFCFDNSEDFV
jgi:hypothetical protein